MLVDQNMPAISAPSARLIAPFEVPTFAQFAQQCPSPLPTRSLNPCSAPQQNKATNRTQNPSRRFKNPLSAASPRAFLTKQTHRDRPFRSRPTFHSPPPAQSAQHPPELNESPQSPKPANTQSAPASPAALSPHT